MNLGRTSVPYKGMPTGRWWNLENNAIAAVKELPEVKYATGMVWASQFYASRGDRKGEYAVMGHMPDYQKINPERLLFGRYITELDMARKRKVCLIGTQIWKDLFPGGEDPTGEIITLQGTQFTVIGVQKRQSQMMSFSDVARTIVLPAPLVQQMFGMGSVQFDTELDLVVQLEKWVDGKFYDRLGLGEEMYSILGVKLPYMIIPVRPGRNLAGIVEIATMKNRQMKFGYNPARVFVERVDRQIDALTRQSEEQK